VSARRSFAQETNIPRRNGSGAVEAAAVGDACEGR